MKPVARAVVHVLALLACAPLAAQEPVQAYTPADRYNTFSLGAQVTGTAHEGRDILFSWGRMRTLGSAGEWMPRLELSAGLTTGQELIDGLVFGPSVGVGYAFPSQHMGFGRDTRAEPYLVGAASVYGVGEFGQAMGSESRWGVAPALSVGVGLRTFSDEWDVDLSTFEVVVEKRLAFDDNRAQIIVRFGRALAPRERRPPPDSVALIATLPPPPPPSSSSAPR